MENSRANGISDHQDGEELPKVRSWPIQLRSPRSRQAEPVRLHPGRFSSSDLRANSGSSLSWLMAKLSGMPWSVRVPDKEQSRRGKRKVGKAWYQRKRVWSLLVIAGLMGFFLLVNWLMLWMLQDERVGSGGGLVVSNSNSNSSSRVRMNITRGYLKKLGKKIKPQKGPYGRLLALSAHALAEGHNKPEPKDLWLEPFVPASSWRPCSDQRSWEPSRGNNGYIIITANGGMNQQRVAVCNAVVIARLLNATLVLPRFMYSSVWRDVSQFGDIYQEKYFIEYLSPDIRIVRKLPKELKSLDLEAIGSLITDADIGKESKPGFYVKNVLPILIRNRVVHFFGFGNRLAFDPIPSQLQRLRCRCNFHALRFAPKIQETGSLLLQRMRRHHKPGLIDHHLVGSYSELPMLNEKDNPQRKASRYLSLHLRFEIDMVAHSLCEFGGGEEERKEMEAYRELHFPSLSQLEKTAKLPSAAALREEGLCPLTPEEAVLMLAALGFRRKTRIYVAGANIYGGRSRLNALNTLYPSLVTKETLLSASELEQFKNFSSQLAALDFIVCTAADAFAMTDSGSQLSSLVSGYRIYYGGGKMPTIRPNKRRLADIFTRNNTIEWRIFEQRVRKAVRQTKHVQTRPVARSIYRYPRCKECMCRIE